MITRIKTSKESKERLESLNRALRMSSSAIVLRYAISKSIKCEKNIMEDDDAVCQNTSGFEIARTTLFGEHELLYKLAMGLTQDDPDDVFFPKLTLMHIERGLKLLERDYKFAGNKEKFIMNLINKIIDWYKWGINETKTF